MTIGCQWSQDLTTFEIVQIEDKEDYRCTRSLFLTPEEVEELKCFIRE